MTSVEKNNPSSTQRVTEHPPCDVSKTSNTYYPCKDSSKPVCRQFVNQGKCRKHLKCRFYHPPVITPTIRKKATRNPGYCYCGSMLKYITNSRPYHRSDDKDTPTFFTVCSRTCRSIGKCM